MGTVFSVEPRGARLSHRLVLTMASSRDSSATFRRASVSADILKTTFERFDADKDGFMVLDEFYEAMQDLIAKKIFPDVTALTKDESDEIFLDCDQDDDGA